MSKNFLHALRMSLSLILHDMKNFGRAHAVHYFFYWCLLLSNKDVFPLCKERIYCFIYFDK